MLRRLGWHVNHKRVERIWRREGPTRSIMRWSSGTLALSSTIPCCTCPFGKFHPI